ncbi:MAG: hypothetical protein MHM6MM_003401 [Cercozoa sp. M6MM]
MPFIREARSTSSTPTLQSTPSALDLPLCDSPRSDDSINSAPVAVVPPKLELKIGTPSRRRSGRSPVSASTTPPIPPRSLTHESGRSLHFHFPSHVRDERSETSSPRSVRSMRPRMPTVLVPSVPEMHAIDEQELSSPLMEMPSMQRHQSVARLFARTRCAGVMALHVPPGVEHEDIADALVALLRRLSRSARKRSTHEYKGSSAASTYSDTASVHLHEMAARRGRRGSIGTSPATAGHFQLKAPQPRRHSMCVRSATPVDALRGLRNDDLASVRSSYGGRLGAPSSRGRSVRKPLVDALVGTGSEEEVRVCDVDPSGTLADVVNDVLGDNSNDVDVMSPALSRKSGSCLSESDESAFDESPAPKDPYRHVCFRFPRLAEFEQLMQASRHVLPSRTSLVTRVHGATDQQEGLTAADTPSIASVEIVFLTTDECSQLMRLADQERDLSLQQQRESTQQKIQRGFVKAAALFWKLSPFVVVLGLWFSLTQLDTRYVARRPWAALLSFASETMLMWCALGLQPADQLASVFSSTGDTHSVTRFVGCTPPRGRRFELVKTGHRHLAPHVKHVPASHSYWTAHNAVQLFRIVLENVRGEFLWLRPESSLSRDAFSSLEDYTQLFASHAFHAQLQKPLLFGVDKLYDDRLWAHQFVAGINPVVLRRAMSLLEVQQLMRLSEEDEKRLEQEINLKQSVEQGRIFVADLALTSMADPLHGRVVHAPAVLFVMDARRELMPVAIQIVSGAVPEARREHHGHEPQLVWRNENDNAWTFAKICTMVADAHVHEFASHLGDTHLALEPVVVLLHRVFEEMASDEETVEHLLDQHLQRYPSVRHSQPLEAWREALQREARRGMLALGEHCSGAVAINDLGRKTLLVRHGMFDEVSSAGARGALQIIDAFFAHGDRMPLPGEEGSEGWRFLSASFPERMKRRGFVFDEKNGSSDDYPWHFAYLEDGTRVYDALHRYARQLVDFVWPGLPEECSNTSEDLFLQKDGRATSSVLLTQLLRELREVSSLFADLPTCASRPLTVDFIAHFLFQSMAQHSAVNFAQYDFYAYPPTRPLFQTLPFPPAAAHSALSEKYMVQAIADVPRTVHTIQSARVLSVPPNGRLEDWRGDVEAMDGLPIRDDGSTRHERRLLLRARANLLSETDEMAQVMEARNADLEAAGYFHFPWLLPSNLALAIDV